MADKRSILQIKLAAVKRYAMWHSFSKSLDLICVTEYPKCGASWICQILASYYDLPFPRNVSPAFEKSIMHSHYLPKKGINKQVCFVRDGRDVVVSYYHHLLLGNNKMSIHSVERFRKLMPFSNYDDIKKNLPEFIHYLFGPKPVYPRFSWKTFCEQMLQEDFFYVKYEDMLLDATETSEKVIQYLDSEALVDLNKLRQICDEFSFRKQSVKEKGSGEKSYLRKGIAGDWKNVFNGDACQIFKQYAGKELIQLGYENNDNWGV